MLSHPRLTYISLLGISHLHANIMQAACSPISLCRLGLHSLDTDRWITTGHMAFWTTSSILLHSESSCQRAVFCWTSKCKIIRPLQKKKQESVHNAVCNLITFLLLPKRNKSLHCQLQLPRPILSHLMPLFFFTWLVQTTGENTKLHWAHNNRACYSFYPCYQVLAVIISQMYVTHW